MSPNMTDSHDGHFTREVAEKQATSGENLPEAGDFQLLDRRKALERFGLTKYQLEQAREHGQLNRYQLGGEGRWYYAENQLAALAEWLKSRKASNAYTYSNRAA
jgi:hypothetical protein